MKRAISFRNCLILFGLCYLLSACATTQSDSVIIIKRNIPYLEDKYGMKVKSIVTKEISPGIIHLMAKGTDKDGNPVPDFDLTNLFEQEDIDSSRILTPVQQMPGVYVAVVTEGSFDTENITYSVSPYAGKTQEIVERDLLPSENSRVILYGPDLQVMAILSREKDMLKWQTKDGAFTKTPTGVK